MICFNCKCKFNCCSTSSICTGTYFLHTYMYVQENILHGLGVAYWNINGLFRKSEDYCKLLDPLFINEVKKCDIIGISEIHCGDQEELNFDGYKSIISTRPKPPKARKHSGGILILIKNNIAQGIKLVKSNSGGYIWLKLDKTFFNIN